MLNDTKRQFVCGLPYQLSIYEGIVDREAIEDEMAETDFSEIKFQIRMTFYTVVKIVWHIRKRYAVNSFNCWNPLRAIFTTM